MHSHKEDIEKILANMKSMDVPENAYPLISDQDLASFVHAWSKLEVFFPEPPDGVRYETAGDLWSQGEYDDIVLTMLINQSKPKMFSLVAKAKGLSLIYPDGTIASSATEFFITEIEAAQAKNEVIILKSQQAPRPVGRPPLIDIPQRKELIDGIGTEEST